MTDLEKIVAVFSEIGLSTTVKKHYEGGESWITLFEGDKKVGGYNSFYTRFEFNKDGKFIECGAYE